MSETNTNKISASLEDYLEAIYIISKNKPEVRNIDIAEFLSVSKPSVNKAINVLKDAGYIEHEIYGEIKLNSSGKKRAKQVLDIHNLLTDFLHKTLGVDFEIAEKDACRMEHVISNESIEKLSKFCKDLNK